MTTILTCAMAAKDVYENRPGTVVGYHPFHWSDSGSRGFFGASYSAGKVGLIAFRGSLEIKEDWLDADIDIFRRRFPISQLGDAFKYYGEQRNALMKQRHCERFIIVGHSLGGALAAVVASASHRVPTKAVTFNAPGMAGISRMGNYSDPELDRDILSMATKVATRVGQSLGMTAGLLTGALAGAGLKAYATAVADQTQVGLKLDQRNSDNVLNVIMRGDLVSMKGNHFGGEGQIRYVEVGRVVTSVKDGYSYRSTSIDPVKAHSIDLLVTALRTDPVGAERV